MTSFPTTLDSFVNPTATDKLNGTPNPAVLHHTQHSDLNDAVSALEAKVGVNFSNVNSTVDYALQILNSTQTQHSIAKIRDVVGPPFPSQVIWYADLAKTIKLVEKFYTYGPGAAKFITQVQYKLYDGTVSNVIKRTITDSITLTGPFETSRTRTVT